MRVMKQYILAGVHLCECAVNVSQPHVEGMEDMRPVLNIKVPPKPNLDKGHQEICENILSLLV